jgi:Na+/proline symporter
MSVMGERLTAIWALLMAATCTSTWLLTEGAVGTTLAEGGIFLIAAIKVRFVMLDFMALRHAPLPVRAAFEDGSCW